MAKFTLHLEYEAKDDEDAVFKAKDDIINLIPVNILSWDVSKAEESSGMQDWSIIIPREEGRLVKGGDFILGGQEDQD